MIFKAVASAWPFFLGAFGIITYFTRLAINAGKRERAREAEAARTPTPP